MPQTSTRSMSLMVSPAFFRASVTAGTGPGRISRKPNIIYVLMSYLDLNTRVLNTKLNWPHLKVLTHQFP